MKRSTFSAASSVAVSAFCLLLAPAVAQDAINPDGLTGQAGRPYSPYACLLYTSDAADE